MSTAKAFAAPSASSALEAISIPRRDVGPDDVEFKIDYCGVCHSDLHTARNETRRLLSRVNSTLGQTRQATGSSVRNVFICQFLVLVLMFVQSSNAVAADTPLEIGVLVPLTGPIAFMGEEVQAGLHFTTQELRHRKMSSVTFFIEDTANESSRAVSGFHSLRKRNVAVMLAFGSATAVPIASLANREKVLLIAGATNSDNYPRADDFAFRVNGSASLEAVFIANSLDRSCESKPIAVLVLQSEYPMSIWESLEPRLLAKHDVVSTLVLPSDQDYSSFLVRLRERRPRCAALLSFYPQAARFLVQTKKVDIQFDTVIAINSVLNADFFALGGTAVDGLLVTNRSYNRDSELAKRIIQEHGKELPGAFVDAFDALMLLGTAASNCPKHDVECLRTALSSIKDYQGLAGAKQFDEFGNMIDQYELLRVDSKTRQFRLQ